MNKTSKPVYWNEGQLLLPQHFQQENLYLRQLLARVSNSSNPYNWGVRSLKIKINEKNFEILDGEFWFKDEIPLHLFNKVEKTGDTIVVKNSILDEIAEKNTGEYFICLNLSNNYSVKSVESIEKVLLSEIMIDTRFFSTKEEEKVKNIHDNDEGGLYRLYNVLQVKLSATSEHYQTLISIIKIINGQLGFDYIPPSINLDFEINGYNGLLEIIKSIQNTLEDYSDHLEPVGINILPDGEKDDNYRIILAALNRNIGIIDQLIKQKEHTHPWEIFVLLTGLIMELSTFSPQEEFAIEALKKDCKYNHLDLYKTFYILNTKLDTLLKEITVKPELSIPIEPNGQSVNLKEKLEDKMIYENIDKYSFYFIFRPKLKEKTEEEIDSLLDTIQNDFKHKNLKFGSPEQINTATRSRGAKGDLIIPDYKNRDELQGLLSKRFYNIYFEIKLTDIKKVKSQIEIKWEDPIVKDIRLYVVKK